VHNPYLNALRILSPVSCNGKVLLVLQDQFVVHAGVPGGHVEHTVSFV